MHISGLGLCARAFSCQGVKDMETLRGRGLCCSIDLYRGYLHYDQALRNAITIVFPESSALLCAWHANKNIQQHCKGSFSTTEAWEAFFKAWQGIVSAETQEKYKEQLHHFTITYSHEPAHTYIEYIRNTWLKPRRKESLVKA